MSVSHSNKQCKRKEATTDTGNIQMNGVTTELILMKMAVS